MLKVILMSSLRMVQRESIRRTEFNNPFARYKPEKVEEVRKSIVQESETLQQFRVLWAKIQNMSKPNKGYRDIVDGVKQLDYSASDVENFSLILSEFQNEKQFSVRAGVMLSALINSGKDDNYVVHTRHLDTQIDYLGYENTKNIIVDGDAGGLLGHAMKRGRIIVKGSVGVGLGDEMHDGEIIVEKDAGYAAGSFMKGGKIRIEENADDNLGQMMSDGLIIVRGNAGRTVGSGMKGGTILMQGHYEGLSDNIRNGRVYHKGKRIVDRQYVEGGTNV